MDTINNVASAAAKAVWGNDTESKQEPVSGLKGNTERGEPYDAGNMDADKLPDLATPTEAAAPLDRSAADTTPGQKSAPQPTGDSKTVNTDQPKRASISERPEENVVSETDLKTPGPRPLDELAKVRGGDAGNVARDAKADVSSSAAGGSTSVQESHEEGTGEQYVKSTGFAAEGGDFDAANPGAGREADRLVGEHVHPSDAGAASGSTATKQSSPGSNNGEKKSLKERIKAKLHKH